MRRAALAALLLAALPAAAEEGPNLAPAVEAAAPGPVRQLVLAQDLYDLGLAREDAVMLLAAIRLARQAPPRPATGWAHEGAGSPAGDIAAAPGLPRDPASPEALALAVMMAEGSPALADVAADVEAALNRAEPGRGHVSTAAMVLPGGKADSWRIAFNGGLPAEVALMAEDGGPLDLTVTDEGGAAICDEPPGDRAFCAFTPSRNGFFTVTVTNGAGGDTRYRLITN